mmetsp:Transcript_74369/g.112047  ORF Transcript_74369/g.112047 Transcript_74369/m.112047 type:complete len:613 (-) Transcript_74369:175-2013(-)
MIPIHKVILHTYLFIFIMSWFNFWIIKMVALWARIFVSFSKIQSAVRFYLSGDRAKKQALQEYEMTRVSHWPERTDYFRRLAEVGLLESVWPADQVLLGMCVCKWMREELPSHVHDVNIHVYSRQNLMTKPQLSTCLQPFRNKTCLHRLRGNNVTILWRGNLEPLIFGMSVAMHGVTPARMLFVDKFQPPCEPNERFGKALTHLDLAWNHLGPKGAEKLHRVLKGSKSLRHLNLRSSKLGDAGTKSVAALLSNCKELSSLNLGWNEIGDSGAVSLGLLFAMGHFNQFEHLDLSGNWLGPYAVGRLAPGIETCSALQHLDLSHNDLGEGGASRVGVLLGRSSSITTLLLMGNRIRNMGVEQFAEGVGRAPALTHLDLAGNWVGENRQGVKALAKRLTRSSTLTTLGLSKSRIGSEEMPILAELLKRCPTITHLDLSYNNIGPDGAAVVGQVLAECLHLRHVALDVTGLQENGALLLARAFTHPSKPPEVNTPVSFALQAIHLRSQRMGAAGMQAVAAALSLCKSLQDLNLACNAIENDGAVSVARSLPEWPDLRRLDLSENMVGDAGAWAMVRHLGSCPQLEFLNVGGNAIRSRPLSALTTKFRKVGRTFVVF